METIYAIVNDPNKAYVYDVLKDAQLPTVVLEVPFFIRHNEDAGDFKKYAQRDFDIIVNLTRKAAIKKGFLIASVQQILEQAKMTLFVGASTNTDAGFLRAFITFDGDAAALVAICNLLYEGCLGNLHPSWRTGGLKPGIPFEPKKKKRAPRQLNDLEKDLEKQAELFYGLKSKQGRRWENAIEEIAPIPSEVP